MNILAGVFFLLAILIALRCAFLSKLVMKLEWKYKSLEAAHEQRDRALDWLLRQYELHTDNPYVDRTTLGPVKRCYHCNIPQTHPHAPDCPWVVVRPLCKILYHPV